MIYHGPTTSASGTAYFGLCLSHDGPTLIARALAMPVRPIFSYQTSVNRSVRPIVNRYWNVLTDDQRTAWQTYAAESVIYDSWNNPQHMPEWRWYVRTNRPRLQFNLGFHDDAPTTAGVIQGTPPSFSPNDDHTSITVWPEPDDGWATEDNGVMFLWISIPDNETVTHSREHFRPLGYIPGSSTSPPDEATFAIPAQSQITGTSFTLRYSVQRADGRQGP